MRSQQQHWETQTASGKEDYKWKEGIAAESFGKKPLKSSCLAVEVALAEGSKYMTEKKLPSLISGPSFINLDEQLSFNESEI